MDGASVRGLWPWDGVTCSVSGVMGRGWGPGRKTKGCFDELFTSPASPPLLLLCLLKLTIC